MSDIELYVGLSTFVGEDNARLVVHAIEGDRVRVFDPKTIRDWWIDRATLLEEAGKATYRTHRAANGETKYRLGREVDEDGVAWVEVRDFGFWPAPPILESGWEAWKAAKGDPDRPVPPPVEHVVVLRPDDVIGSED